MAKRKVYKWHRRKYWRCPYFGWDGPDFLRCECGRPAFQDKAAANIYMIEYCAGNWEGCSLAKAHAEYEEAKHDKGRSNSNAE